MSIENFQISAQALIRHLARAIPQGDAALFAGAGLSLNAEYVDPDSATKFERWNSLIERACKELGEDPDDLAGRYSYPEILEFYRQRFNRNTLVQLIHDGVPDKNGKPGELHLKLLDQRRFMWSSVITTNIDTLIEKALEALAIPYRRLAKKEDFAGGTGVAVVKLHGTFDDPGTYVFTENEYNGIETNKPLLIAKVRQIYAEKSCLFIGYSLKDPDFRRIVQTVRDLSGSDLRISVAIIPDVDAHEKRYWEGHGVHILSRSDLSNKATGLSAAEFVNMAVDAILAAASSDSPATLCQLNPIARLWRFRTKYHPVHTGQGFDPVAFIDGYLAARDRAISDLFFDKYPKEALQVLLEAGGDWLHSLESILSTPDDLLLAGKARQNAVTVLLRDIGSLLRHNLRELGVFPPIPPGTLNAAVDLAKRIKGVPVEIFQLAVDLKTAESDAETMLDTKRYEHSKDSYVRLLPQYLNILRSAERCEFEQAKRQLFLLRSQFEKENPLWEALVLWVCGDDTAAAGIALRVRDSHTFSVRIRFLAAQFLRDFDFLQREDPDIHYEVAHFRSLCLQRGVPIEDLEFDLIRERQIAGLLEVSAKGAFESDASIDAVVIFKNLLTRHRLLGMPYAFYNRAALTYWLQFELKG